MGRRTQRIGGSSKKLDINIDYIYIRNLYLADLHDYTDDEDER
jgi:hypothetical protein